MCNINSSNRKLQKSNTTHNRRYKMLNDFADLLTFIQEACHTTPVLMFLSAHTCLEGRESSSKCVTKCKFIHLAGSGLRREELLCYHNIFQECISITSSFSLHPTTHCHSLMRSIVINTISELPNDIVLMWFPSIYIVASCYACLETSTIT